MLNWCGFFGLLFVFCHLLLSVLVVVLIRFKGWSSVNDLRSAIMSDINTWFFLVFFLSPRRVAHNILDYMVDVIFFW